jgi:hypothetical protein
MTEADIMHAAGLFWVCRERNAYTVYRSGLCASGSDSTYAKTPDGLSIAIGRCNWLAKRHAEQTA